MENHKDQNSGQSLRHKWSSFLNVLLDPWVISLLVLTIILWIYLNRISSNQSSNRDVIAILTTIVSVVSGLLGGVIANRWSQMTEMKVLVARGKSAIRSLKLILLNISNVEKRTKEYIQIIDEENSEYKLIVSNFEEVIEKCNILEEEIISSIENWTDIIPEVANLKTQIGLVTEMKSEKLDLEEDIKMLKVKLRNGEEKTKEREELQKLLIEKEEELARTKDRLKNKEKRFNTTVLSGLTSGLNTSIIDSSSLDIDISKYIKIDNEKKCASCGKPFTDNGIVSNDKCESCRINLFHFQANTEK